MHSLAQSIPLSWDACSDSSAGDVVILLPQRAALLRFRPYHPSWPAKGTLLMQNPKTLAEPQDASSTANIGDTSDVDPAVKSLIERSIAAWSSLHYTGNDREVMINISAHLLRCKKTLDDVLASGKTWFFQEKKSFMKQTLFSRWDSSQLDTYILIPVVPGFVNKDDYLFISHYWNTREHPDPDGEDCRLLQDFLWKFPSFQPRLWVLFEVAVLILCHRNTQLPSNQESAQFISDVFLMVYKDVRSVVRERGYKCTNESDADIVIGWSLSFSGRSSPHVAERRRILDLVDSFTSNFSYYGAVKVDFDLANGTITSGGVTHKVTPMPHLKSGAGFIVRFAEFILADQRVYHNEVLLERQWREFDKRLWAFGPTHPTTVIALCHVQVALHIDGKHEESEAAHMRMVDLKRAAMKILLAENNYKKAEEMQRAIVDLFKEIYGVKNKYTLASMGVLGNLLIKKEEELDEAESLLRETLKYCDTVLGPSIDLPRAF
ncbi:hypothetical protein MGYG_05370 [Nannizzia gypsea CBS 118893]|uniref:Uncharacterized protein n=1 Tax=Arthroderma gypseum (strain ATCC MYA-4604 / CBS 118893) TaxID=535722 RepID=E4UVP7_ARTGP|nr:hypothetical protein MGYG_05370 [Nannizzia gypsea CBS 118893]EFR02374.1 hypothetical protein MGYG_05370 [Nannizzia gypsea CBS 118893]